MTEKERLEANEPHPIDIHVGGRVRLRRVMVGLSQVKLAKEVGLTFQQIQKYEKGANRICASRLFEFARILDVSVEYFFEESAFDEPKSANGKTEASDPYSIHDFLNSREGLELNRAFLEIKEERVRRIVLDLMRTLSD